MNVTQPLDRTSTTSTPHQQKKIKSNQIKSNHVMQTVQFSSLLFNLAASSLDARIRSCLFRLNLSTSLRSLFNGMLLSGGGDRLATSRISGVCLFPFPNDSNVHAFPVAVVVVVVVDLVLVLVVFVVDLRLQHYQNSCSLMGRPLDLG
mmetsp:Transcript_2778/g.3938  ORF Transcript_2778/g.3938 Transcript_2778/m.3938 type:complete len:148 (+) Transcript_2778:446-889(+)